MADFKDLKFDWDSIKNNMNFANVQPIMPDFSEDSRKLQKIIAETHEAKAKEELRRHNELVDALKQAGDNGATIVIGNDAKDIQIQQNTQNSSQTMINQNKFDYEKVAAILNEIREYFEYPKFKEAFKDNEESIKNLVQETISSVERKEEPSLIRKSLSIIKDLAVGAGSGLIATGITALLATIL